MGHLLPSHHAQPKHENPDSPAAAIYTLIHTAKLNDVDPQAWLADVLARIADHPIADLPALLPWRWAQEREHRKLAA